MRAQEIVFNLTGQSFIYDPPERYRPSGTPTVTVYQAGTDDDGATETATTGSCSVDSVNTTLSASASLGAQTFSVTSATGIARDRRYLLTDTDGNTEWVEVQTITGTTIGVRLPLTNAYASGSTFQGCRISIAINSTWVADKSNISDVIGATWDTATPAAVDSSPGLAGYRLRWSYTVNSVATIGFSFADLVRYPAKDLVSPLDVDNRFRGWIDRLGPDDREDQGAAIIDEAFYAVKLDAMADAQLLRRIRNTEVVRELVICRANVIQQESAMLAGRQDSAGLETAQAYYKQRYDQLIREPKVPVDQTGGGASGEAVRLPPWRR